MMARLVWIALVLPAWAGTFAAEPAGTSAPGAAFLQPADQASPAPAAAGDTLGLTLEDVIGRARAHSPRLEQLRAMEAASAAAVQSARAARIPQLDVAAGYTRSSHIPPFTVAIPRGPELVLSPDIPDTWRSRISVTAPVVTGGRINGAIRVASREREAAAAEREAGVADLVLETVQAYWDLGTVRENQRVLGEALAAYDAHLTDARNRASVGLAARNEVLAVEVERDRAELSAMRAGAAAQVAEENLVRLIGLPPGTHVKPADPLRTGVSADTAFSPAALDRLTGEALAARPERAALSARVAAAEARTAVERAARWPQVGASAGYDYANPNRRFFPPAAEWKGSWDASLTLSATLFGGGRISSAIRLASAQARALREQLRDLDARLRLEIVDRALDLRTAEAALATAGRAREAARENRKVAQDRYREGVGSSTDLLDAETMLLRAGLEETDALSRAQVARAALDRALGRTGSGEGSALP